MDGLSVPRRRREVNVDSMREKFRAAIEHATDGVHNALDWGDSYMGLPTVMDELLNSLERIVDDEWAAKAGGGDERL